MTNAELTAYNYGRDVYREARMMVAEGRGQEMPSLCLMPLEASLALRQLGREAFWSWMRRGVAEAGT